MDKYIMCGLDLHDKMMVLNAALDLGEPERMSYPNTRAGRRAMIREFRACAKAAGGARVVFVYEASSLGFGLCDELNGAGFVCHVLAPTRIARSRKHRRGKTDAKDAERLLEVLRGHLLAGNKLPAVWLPDPATRDEREVVRARLDLTVKRTALKAQVRTLLKRNSCRKPADLGRTWTLRYCVWLSGLASSKGDGARRGLPPGARAALGTLLRQLKFLQGEIAALDAAVGKLSRAARYRKPADALQDMKGIGLLTAMVYLTEMGDLSRFSNRRQIGSYLGLVPTSNESGESSDRKGHITRDGNPRVRKALCQATWSRVRTHPEAKAAYQRVVAKNPKHKKIAVVASMRRLSIRMWHIGRRAQAEAGSYAATTERIAEVA